MHRTLWFLSALVGLTACAAEVEVADGEEGREDGEASMPGDCDKCDGGWADPEADLPPQPEPQPDPPVTPVSAGEFSSTFAAFLATEYADYAFGEGYGGWEAGSDTTLTHDPVVFIHGNGDQAVGGSLGGWSASIAGFRSAGYADGELYAFTWGPADVSRVSSQYHSREHLQNVRAFLLAVLDYTGAERIDVVAHSMGVTLARKAILGGAARDALAGGAYDLGASIASRVDSFVGVAGANLGLAACWFSGPTTPTCGATNGLYPGRLVWYQVVGASAFLEELNGRSDRLANDVSSLWSPDDNIIGFDGLVWGNYTARIPGQDGEVRLDDVGHFALRDEWEVQLSLLD